MRPWTGIQSEALYGDTMRAKPLSKLDNAKLKLSKLKLKYGKQEKRLYVDPPSSSTGLSPLETSPTDTNIQEVLPKETSENSDAMAKDLEAKNGDGKSFESDSLKSVRSKELYLPKIGLSNEELIQSQTGSPRSPSDSSISEIHENIHSFSSLELRSQIRDEDASSKPVPDDVVNNVEPAVILQRDATETSVSSIASESREAEIEHSQMAPAAALQETSNGASSAAASEITLESLDKSPERVSSVTLVSLKQEPRVPVRSVKVQTERKRSRSVQVSLSEHTYEGRSRPSYPVLRASSLPRGLRTQEESFGCLASDMEDAVQLLLRSQMKLTLNLLRREQTLYLNCSRSAKRLEKVYTRHTLSDTRQFISREKKLRNEQRGNAK